MFKVLIGDLFESKAQTLVNTVNCVGAMGKGVAEQFKKQFPAMFDDYVGRCKRREVRIGEPYLYGTADVQILNFPTKDHWRSPSRLKDVERGLDYFVDHALAWGISSVAMPPLGCGNGGLEWSEVGPLIYRKLHGLSIDVEVYAPYGTPKRHLTMDFLAAPSQMSLEGKGGKQERLNANWVALAEVLRGLEEQRYANPVGRTIFQRICYVVTEMGVPTGFEFGKGSYGPFSDTVKLALHDFANRNWLHEEQLGRMVALKLTSQYAKDRARFTDQIKLHEKKIAKVVDLFSRIKSTEQAEEVITVLFASRQLKRANPDGEVSEQQLLDFIVGWKKSWDKDEKRQVVTNAIRNLALLGWMRVRLDESVDETA